jgi:glycosyltransferase involved in cell wall biosynthesis
VATNNGTRHVYLSGFFDLLRRVQPDVIDLYEEPFSFVALQALLGRAAFAPRAALVFYSAVNVHRAWRLPYRLVERLMLAKADGAYTPNAAVPPILRAKGMRASAVTIPLGVDVERFASAEPARLERILGGAPRPYVGFLGRLEPVKGLDVLVEAVARTHALPGTVVVAGDGPERARLEALVAERGLAARVRFPGGMPFAEVPGFIRALDALVLPSVTIPPEHKEQFGRVLVEAMAAGTPVVGSSSGAIPEVIGDAGLVVPERDPAALARALERLLGSADVRASLVARGRERARGRFGWPVVARETLDLYRAALAHRRGIRASLRMPTGPGR